MSCVLAATVLWVRERSCGDDEGEEGDRNEESKRHSTLDSDLQRSSVRTQADIAALRAREKHEMVVGGRRGGLRAEATGSKHQLDAT